LRTFEELELIALELSFFTKKEERRKIEASHRESKRNLEPKIRKILFGISLLEQTPRFTTDKNFVTMNP
jgi:hypothetical protein